MDLRQLRSFTAVVKYGSFSKAAEMLYLSQPTISSHVRALEEELDTCLIRRTTKSIQVTPRGYEVYQVALSILEQRDRLLERWSGQGQQLLRIGTTAIPSSHILPEILPAYRQGHPGAAFSIHQNDFQQIVSGLTDGTFDIALLESPCDRDELTCLPFFRDRTVIITPMDQRFLELQAQPGSHLRELLREPVILRDHDSSSLRTANRFFQRLGIREEELHIIAWVNNQEAIKNMVAAGLGISFLSQLAVRQYLEEQRLVMFPLPEYGSRRSLYLAYRRDQTLPPYLRDFVRFIRDRYA